MSEFVASLSANGVRYLVVGGYAVAAHGHPRFTKDLDIWIEATPDNAQRVLKAMDAFGFSGLGLVAADFVEPGSVIQLGNPPQRIDLLTSMSGVQFGECYEMRVQLLVGSQPVDFIDLDNLVRNKTASGRPQDLADVAALRKTSDSD
ncbi:MAG: DUF6036 family nucleotidyltransferase [Burkholderiales bacterium]|nr:DUF6036 family nucleotidyltransferase [Burkholderiales bacterium]